METVVKLYSNDNKEIFKFLRKFLKETDKLEKGLSSEWQKKYQNPLEAVDIIGTFIENNDKFDINMWVSLDKDVFINITDSNADKIIRYLYERYPW